MYILYTSAKRGLLKNESKTCYKICGLMLGETGYTDLGRTTYYLFGQELYITRATVSFLSGNHASDDSDRWTDTS